MRLRECHIDGFGALSDLTFVFDEEPKVVCLENGAGKTTLAAFLRAMFYGMKTVRAGAKDFLPREHYAPFSGGAFGGSLTVEKDGDLYTVVRRFDRKSDTRDVFKVFLREKEIPDPSLFSGEALFGVDEESFLRTVYSDGSETGSPLPPALAGKLALPSGADGEETDFSKAVEILKKRKKEIVPERGQNGLLGAVDAAIREKDGALLYAKETAAGLPEAAEKLRADENRLRGLEKKLAEARTLELKKAEYTHYSSLLARAEEERRRIGTIEESYPAGIPSPEKREQLKKAAAAAAELRVRAGTPLLSEEQKKSLETLRAIFPSGAPDEEKVRALRDSCAKLRSSSPSVPRLSSKRADERIAALSSEIASLPAEDGRFSALSARFGEKLTPEAVYSVKENLSTLREIRETGEKSGKPEKPVLPLILLIAGVLLALAGVALLLRGAAFWIPFPVAGAVLIALSLFPLLSGAKKRKAEDAALYAETLRRRNAEEKIEQLLSPLGYPSGDAEGAAEAFLEDVSEYDALKEAESARRGKAASLEDELRRAEDEKEKAAAAEAEIALLLAGSGLSLPGEEDPDVFADRVADRAKEYAILRKAALDAEKARETAAKAALEAEEEIGRLLAACSLPAGRGVEEILNAAERDEEALKAALSSRDGLRKEAEEYRAAHPSVSSPPGEGTAAEPEEIEREIHTLRASIADGKRSFESACRTAETIPALEEEIASLREKENELKEKNDALADAIYYLTEADRSLKDKYAGPLLEAFRGYAAAVEALPGEGPRLDGEYRVLFRAGGEPRKEQFLSAGQREITDLCLRLAVTKVLFGDKLPLLILDDPFVHLDEKRLKKVFSVLRSLPADCQILYFCCHESRDPNRVK